ncbi:site-specific integrase [Methanohalobium evestigatum]|nr:site-specific integrase [Methanohalobium evestigatum]
MGQVGGIKISEDILVKGTKIIGPFEYDALSEQIPKDYLRTIFEILFWSGMRYVELQRLYQYPDWWWPRKKAIHLPEFAQKKSKRKQPERYIYPLPPQFDMVMRYFFKGPNPPRLDVWGENMKRWAEKADMDPKGFSAKTTRKSIESWMVTSGMPLTSICLRQGHDNLTSMRHYQGLPFTDAEKAEIKKRLAWVH